MTDTVEEILRGWQARLLADSDLREWFSGNYCFCFEDIKENWLLAIRSKVELLKLPSAASGSEKGDCILSLESATFLSWIAEGINPQSSYVEGKVKIFGEAALALKLSKLLRTRNFSQNNPLEQ